MIESEGFPAIVTRSFTRFTASLFDKPFDERFSQHMVAATEALMSGLGARYAFTESDEISVLLPPQWDLFDRSVEKIVSIAVGIASSVFTFACGPPAHFDGRVWLGTAASDVVDYFSWRQADAARCALNGWCYWSLRKDGMSARHATALLNRTSVGEKNELLFQRGINFNEVPLWQRRGIGLWWESYSKNGLNPLTQQPVRVERRRVHVERELPMKEDYRSLVEGLAAAPPQR
ncbi:MAG: tRNA(His) guanylyltransferase Thg1 family protein [Anaerolineales bacterium]